MDTLEEINPLGSGIFHQALQGSRAFKSLSDTNGRGGSSSSAAHSKFRRLILKFKAIKEGCAVWAACIGMFIMT